MLDRLVADGPRIVAVIGEPAGVPQHVDVNGKPSLCVAGPQQSRPSPAIKREEPAVGEQR